jgi:hypothetical protein
VVGCWYTFQQQLLPARERRLSGAVDTERVSHNNERVRKDLAASEDIAKPTGQA